MSKKVAVAIVCLFVICTSVFAADITWDGGGGAGDNNWSTAANWSGDSVPGSSDNVTFDGTSTKACTVDSAATMYSLTISSGYTGCNAHRNNV